MKKLFRSNPKLVKNLLFMLLILAIVFVGANLKKANSQNANSISEMTD